ncbi:MAG TPA: metal-sensitive transcriptional regulator [Candidatus Avacidaminococcus intestinavium]|uniref:Metal-sensitive transcriptional regulator n=1 Tax=Candidatus Avacidaminococcus intestinavium TaxID=2840684 RepID=A0A9D1MQE9_9FIRM|nr:metal-sensitive transcriptional regulator [Candidatus Avacidaminococcus intestinavium]
MLNSHVKKSVLTRLKTVKGHIAGIEKMVDNQERCEDILVQLSATRAAIEKIGLYVLENSAKECLYDKELSVEDQAHIQKIVKQVISFMK